MSRRTYQLLALALTLSGTSACDEAPAFGAGDVALRPTGYGSGGVLINTSATGDWAVAHLDRNFGTQLDGVVLEKVVINAGDKYENMQVELEKVWADDDGNIHGAWKWLEFKGAEFEGSRWYLRIPDSVNAPDRVMTIDKYVVDAGGHHRYTFLYPNDPSYGPHFFNYFLFLTPEEQKKLEGEPIDPKQDGEEQVQNLAVCAPDPENGGSIEAIIYPDVYVDMTTGEVKQRLDTINIACLSGGVGKAGLNDFMPQSGLDYFEAAVRMIRSDNCGDGGTFTKPGNQVVPRDLLGIHDFGNYINNQTEAIWGVKGSLCLDEPRDANFAHWDIDCGNGPLPFCKDAKLEDFAPEGMVHTKLP